MAQLITKDILKEKFTDDMANGKKRYVKDTPMITSAAFGSVIPANGTIVDDAMLGKINGAERLDRNLRMSLSGKYESGFDFVFPNRGSVIDRIRKGQFSAAAGGNSLNDNWQDLMDVMRMDITIRKEANPTIRQFIYNVVQMPNSTKDVRIQEFFPHVFPFEENNGEGQDVTLGQLLHGQYDTVPHKIYATGLVWTLLKELFDNPIATEMSRIMDGVTLGMNAKKDDTAIKPILEYAYGAAGTAKHTAASTEGDNRQEKLLNTIMNAVDALAKRTDPVTKRKINASNLVILCSEHDARHINHVIGGLPNDRNRSYPSISAVSRIVAYDGEVMNGPNKTYTYAGVTDGEAYIIKPNRYMSIGVKRELTAEIDMQPDVLTLAREQRAWYYVEALYNALGIANYIQKVTLSAW